MNIWKSRVYNKLRKKVVPYFTRLKKEEKLAYCQRKTIQIPLPYDSKRVAIYLLMKFCAYMTHIMRNNKYVFTSLETHVIRDSKLYFFSEKYYDLLREVCTWVNQQHYKKVLTKANRGDFVFFDPPYFKEHN